MLADRLGLCDTSATARMFEQLINKGQSIARMCKGSKADEPPSAAELTEELWLSETFHGMSKELLEAPSALRGVEFDQVLQLCGIARDWAALVSLHKAVGTAVAEHEAGRGQGRGVDAHLAAQGAHGLEAGQHS